MSAVAPDREHIENLKKSYEQIGPLQDVIIDEYDGKVLAGKHRKYAIADWPEKKVNSEGDPLKRELITIHGNVQRGIPKEETEMRFLRIAKILEDRGAPKESICAQMAKILPYGRRYVEKMLPKEYKRAYTDPETMKEKQMRSSSHLASRIDQQSREIEAKLKPIIEAFMSEDGEPHTNYPFPGCRCRGCPDENICPKYY